MVQCKLIRNRNRLDVGFSLPADEVNINGTPHLKVWLGTRSALVPLGAGVTFHAGQADVPPWCLTDDQSAIEKRRGVYCDELVARYEFQ